MRTNPRPLAFLLALLLALAFFGQAMPASVTHSLTWDEPSFISAGYAYLTRGEFRFNPSHPPLIQALEAAPLLALDLNVPSESFESWEAVPNPVATFGQAFMFRSGNDVRRIAFWARLPILLLGTGLVLMVFFWGRRLYGAWPALIGASLCAFCPNLIAHAGLATEDLGCTALMFAAVWTLWLADQDGGTWRWVRCGFVTGLALLAKYTALLLVPAFLIIGVLSIIATRPRSAATAWLRGLLVAGGVALGVVGIAYGPHHLGWSVYAQGVSRIYTDLAPGYSYYLAGHFSAQPWWYYTLVALAVKTALPTLLLVAAGGALALRGGGSIPDDQGRGEVGVAAVNGRDLAFLLVPAALVLVASMLDHANLGVRRILPALPFLYMLAGRVGVYARAASGRHRVAVTAAACALLGWTALETLHVYPNHLSYFSAMVGGPRQGPNWLDDSNIDWGQDLPALADWQREHPIQGPLYMSYYGTADPVAYGVRAQPVPADLDIAAPSPGTYAMSVQTLLEFRLAALRHKAPLDWLTRFAPIGRAGYSIYVYQFR